MIALIQTASLGVFMLTLLLLIMGADRDETPSEIRLDMVLIGIASITGTIALPALALWYAVACLACLAYKARRLIIVTGRPQ